MNIKKKFIKDYVDRAFADTSRGGIRSSSFYKYFYRRGSKTIEKCHPKEDENGFEIYLDENGEYYVRNCLRPYEFRILYAKAKQAFDEQVLNFPPEKTYLPVYSLLKYEDVKRGVDNSNTSKKNKEQIKKNRVYIAQLMKQNQR